MAKHMTLFYNWQHACTKNIHSVARLCNLSYSIVANALLVSDVEDINITHQRSYTVKRTCTQFFPAMERCVNGSCSTSLSAVHVRHLVVLLAIGKVMHFNENVVDFE